MRSVEKVADDAVEITDTEVRKIRRTESELTGEKAILQDKISQLRTQIKSHKDEIAEIDSHLALLVPPE